MVFIGLLSDKISKVYFQNLKFEEVYIYFYLTFVIYLCNMDFLAASYDRLFTILDFSLNVSVSGYD